MIDYDAWLESTTQKLHEMLMLDSVTQKVVNEIYEDQRCPQRQLADFDFLLNEPDRTAWLKKAFIYAEENNLWVEHDLYASLRAVRAHRKAKRKQK
jgi:hypothetical protein